MTNKYAELIELAEKARADARREAQLATDKARDLLDAEATISTLTAERDALKRERDGLKAAHSETINTEEHWIARAEKAERERDEAREAGTDETLQARVQPWMMACFGPEISGDKLERGDRLLEEVIELLQSVDYPRDRIRALEDYVYDRPQGEINQEVGGVMITLAAFCLAHDLDMHAAGETELARIWTKVDKIRAKQAAKPTGSALPVALTTSPASSGVKGDGWRPIRKAVIEKDGHEITDMGNGSWRLASPGKPTYQWFTDLDDAKKAASEIVEDRITLDAISEIFGDTFPWLVLKVLFPEKSEPLTPQEARTVCHAIASYIKENPNGLMGTN